MEWCRNLMYQTISKFVHFIFNYLLFSNISWHLSQLFNNKVSFCLARIQRNPSVQSHWIHLDHGWCVHAWCLFVHCPSCWNGYGKSRASDRVRQKMGNSAAFSREIMRQKRSIMRQIMRFFFRCFFRSQRGKPIFCCPTGN